MCGIFAVLGLKGDPKLNRKRVYNLAKRIRHRGPDSYNMDVRVDETAGKEDRGDEGKGSREGDAHTHDVGSIRTYDRKLNRAHAS